MNKISLLGAFLLFATPVLADEQVPLNFDASALAGTPYVAVVNSTKQTVTGISCTGFWGTSPVSIPGGGIPPGFVMVIEFSHGKCNKQINILYRGAASKTIIGFDVDNNTVLDLSSAR